MSAIDLDRLERLLAAATPGTAEVERQDLASGLFCYDLRSIYRGRDGDTCAILVGHVSEEDREGRGLARARADAELWAEMRNALPALIERVRAAEMRAEAAEQHIESVHLEMRDEERAMRADARLAAEDMAGDAYRRGREDADKVPCPKFEQPTPEEVAAEEAESERVFAAIQAGKSPCCGAPFDERQVITSGGFKGHGPRFCSACKRLVFQV